MFRKSVVRLSVVAALLLTSAVAFAQLGVVVTASSTRAASSALLLTSASASIKICDFPGRNALLADIDARVKTAGEAIEELERDATSLTGEARDDFKSALKDVKSQESALKQNLHTAKKATEESWPEQRTLLASTYGEYAGAVSRLETAAARR
jgi:hypothetical protein